MPSTTATEELLARIDTETIENRISELGTTLADLEPLMGEIARVTTNRLDGRDLAQMTTAQRSFLFGALADDLRQPSAEFGAKASNIESTARQFDAEMRAFITEMYSARPQDTQQQMEALRTEIQKGFSGVRESFAQLDELEKSMRIAALASVRLRTALMPITTGLRSLSAAMQIIISWQSIDPSGSAHD